MDTITAPKFWFLSRLQEGRTTTHTDCYASPSCPHRRKHHRPRARSNVAALHPRVYRTGTPPSLGSSCVAIAAPPFHRRLRLHGIEMCQFRVVMFQCRVIVGWRSGRFVGRSLPGSSGGPRTGGEKRRQETFPTCSRCTVEAISAAQMKRSRIDVRPAV